MTTVITAALSAIATMAAIVLIVTVPFFLSWRYTRRHR